MLAFGLRWDAGFANHRDMEFLKVIFVSSWFKSFLPWVSLPKLGEKEA
jgi:hypothetical protein